MKAVKCKTCGKEEWRHTCGPGAPPLATLALGTPIAFIASATNTGPSTTQGRGGKAVTLKHPDGSALKAGDIAQGDIMTVDKATGIVKSSLSRKEYLKLKARDRRARVKAQKQTA